MKYKKLSIGICIGVLLMISIYVYYTIIIKIRPFPEDGDVSLSGCYVTKIYSISYDDSNLVNLIYDFPLFIKIYDAKTKKCLYTSDIYEGDYLFPVFKSKKFTSYGFYEINTECNKEFIPPEEFSPDF